MSSLGEFLNVMYKKRELEYRAKVDQANADVAGAQAIGQGISSFGSAIGSIGQGIGGAMGKMQTDSIATKLAAEQGVTLGGGMMGAASTEFDLRQKMGQLGANQLTPYQKMMGEQGQQRVDIAMKAEQRRYEEGLDAKATAAGKNASKTYNEGVANTNAYINQTTANMAKLHTAETPEVFETHRKAQLAYNQGAAKAGIDPSLIEPVPTEFIPMQNRASYGLFQEEQKFGRGTSNPSAMSQARQAVEASGSDVRYGTAPGNVPPPAMETGIPPGAIPAPNFRGPKGATANNGKYVWDGNFFVPRSQQ